MLEYDINQMKQNKPSLIADDIIHLVDSKATLNNEDVYGVLLQRGVFKWLAARRDLIRLQIRWKERTKIALFIQRIYSFTGDRKRLNYWRGYRAALDEMRKEVNTLCHMPRAIVQDNDSYARRWFEHETQGRKYDSP